MWESEQIPYDYFSYRLPIPLTTHAKRITIAMKHIAIAHQAKSKTPSSLYDWNESSRSVVHRRLIALHANNVVAKRVEPTIHTCSDRPAAASKSIS